MHLLVENVLLVAALLAPAPIVVGEKPIELATIPIAERDYNYQGLRSRLLRSEDDTNALIDDLFGNNRRLSRHHWNEQAGDAHDQIRRATNQRIAKVRKALDSARIDFGTETVAIVFVTSGSGSIRFTVGEPTLEEEVLTLVIDEDVPAAVTMDMAYRAFAIRVPRSVAKQVRIPAERGKYRTYDLATGEEIVEKAGGSDVAPLSMASPQRQLGE